MTQDILEIAHKYAYTDVGYVAKGELLFRGRDIERFANEIQSQEAEKWQARVKELEDELVWVRRIHIESNSKWRESVTDKEVRIAELEDVLIALRNHAMYKPTIEMIDKALANKSDWLQKHDAEVRRKTLEEAAIEVSGWQGIVEQRGRLIDCIHSMAKGVTK